MGTTEQEVKKEFVAKTGRLAAELGYLWPEGCNPGPKCPKWCRDMQAVMRLASVAAYENTEH